MQTETPQFLQKLKPLRKEPPKTLVELDDVIISDTEALQLMRSRGMVELPPNEIQELKRLGIYTAGHGTMTIQRGRAMISQQRLDWAMAMIVALMHKKAQAEKPSIAAVTRLAHELGYLSSKLTENQNFITQGGRNGSSTDPVAPDEPLAKSFAPGSVVSIGANSTVQINAREPKPTEAPAIEAPKQ